MSRRRGVDRDAWRASRTANRRRLDRHLSGLDDQVGSRPACGWIRTIRDALGMSTFDLAGRLGVSRDRVSQLERAEVHGSIPLSTLERVAGALHCRVCYFLAPEEPLETMVRRQALVQAARALASSSLRVGSSQEREEGEEGEEGERDPTVLAEVHAARVESLAHALVDRRGLWRPPRPTGTERP